MATSGRTRRRMLGSMSIGLTAAWVAACGQAAPQPASRSAAPVKLSFAAHGDQSWQEFWNKVVGRFNQSYGPKITAEFFSSEPDGFKKYVVLMASGGMWAVFRNEEKRMPEFAHNKTLLDVTS